MINLVAVLTTPGSYLGVENSSYQLFGQLVQEGAVLESADGEPGPTCLVTAHSAGPL